jgi:hypothetical protein
VKSNCCWRNAKVFRASSSAAAWTWQRT